MKPHHEGMRGSPTADPGLGSGFNPNPKLGLQVLVNPNPNPNPGFKRGRRRTHTKSLHGGLLRRNKMRRKNVSKKKKKPHEIALWRLFGKEKKMKAKSNQGNKRFSLLAKGGGCAPLNSPAFWKKPFGWLLQAGFQAPQTLKTQRGGQHRRFPL